MEKLKVLNHKFAILSAIIDKLRHLMYPSQSIFSGHVYHQEVQLHTGLIEGDKRTIYAGMTNHVLENDPYYLFNIIDQDNIYIDSVAILGVVHVSDATYYAKYIAKTLGRSLDVVLVGSYTAQTLKRFLDSKSSFASPRIKSQQVEQFADVLVKTMVDWDDDRLLSHQGNPRLLLSDMIANDDRGGLLSPMSKERFADMINEERDKEQLDALFTDVVGLTRLARQLTLEMDKKATDKVKLDKITQTEKPFKRHGMTNLALHMAMSDGQTVAVLFYNPDDTPSKLQPKDILVSWKWLLNNRDVTAALQPETGKDVNMAILASRIMQLVDKNHARFVRNVAKQQAQDERIAQLEETISQKETTLAQLDKQIADMQARVDGVLAGDDVGNEQKQNVIDITNYSSDIKEYLENYDELPRAVHAFFNDKLKGRVVRTQIGDVHILGSSWQKKLKFGIKNDELRAKSIPFIPNILSQGQYDGKRLKEKVRKDDYIAFHAFVKEVNIDDQVVVVRLLVGERENNQYEFVVYSLYPNKNEILDELKNPTMVASENAEIMLGSGGIVEHCASHVNSNMLDSIVDGKDGWNIEIVSIESAVGSDVLLPPLTELNISQEMTSKERRKVLIDWLRTNLQGRTITTVDGKKVYFNRNKFIHHLSHDGNIDELSAKATTKIIEVLQQGRFIQRQELYKDRKDNFVAFHIYRKWVDIDDMQVHLQVKAGEFEDGLLEIQIGTNLLAYSQKIMEQDSLPNNHQLLDGVLLKATGLYPTQRNSTMLDNLSQDNHVKDTSLFDGFSIKNSTKSTPHWQNAQLSGETLGATADNDNLFDDLGQDDYVFLEILEVRPIGMGENNQYEFVVNSPAINTWDSTQADNNLQALIEEHDGKLTPACKAFIERYLMDRVFATQIGHVVVNSKSKGKLVDRIRKTKALAIARIPEILLMGQMLEIGELNKARHDSFVQFFTFEKVLSFDEFTAKATLKVGKRQDGQNVAYYLGASKEKVQYDDLNSESTFPRLEQQGVKATTELLDSRTQNATNVNYFEVILDSLQVEILTKLTPIEQNYPNDAQTDIDFLNDVLAGEYDILADDFMAKMELVERINQNNLSRDDLTNDELTVILNRQHPTSSLVGY